MTNRVCMGSEVNAWRAARYAGLNTDVRDP